jgi:hypothetical protein
MLLAAALLTSAATSDVAAQRAQLFVQARAWLGFSYDPVAVARGERPVAVIRDVVDDSPAQRAGLMQGDTILRINGINASDQLMGSLGSSLLPGDDVRVQVRRAGREREFVVTAAERPPQYGMLRPENRFMLIDPDSLRGRVQIWLDSARIRLDSLDMPGVYIQRMREGFPHDIRLRMVPRDSFRFHFDTLGARYFFGDSARMRIDTVWQRLMPRMQRFEFRGDSIFRWDADSVWRLGTTGSFFRADTMPGFREFQLHAMPGISMISVRAIAGAELTELSPGLGEYFGVDEGVLVVRVPAGTPAERAGLHEGDVIVRANGEPIAGVGELRSAVARSTTSQPVVLEVIRKKNRMTLELKRE